MGHGVTLVAKRDISYTVKGVTKMDVQTTPFVVCTHFSYDFIGSLLAEKDSERALQLVYDYLRDNRRVVKELEWGGTYEEQVDFDLAGVGENKYAPVDYCWEDEVGKAMCEWVALCENQGYTIYVEVS